MRLLPLLVSITLCSAAMAQEYRPDFDPSRLKGPAAGGAGEVLVLGSAHLSQLSKEVQQAALQPVIERLARWQPHAIAIESLSGVQCDFMRRNPRRYKDSLDPYCHDTTAARTATGLDVMEATTQAETLLASMPQSPGAAPRSAAAWPPCSWRAANGVRPWCNGCACRPANGAPATVWTPPWSLSCRRWRRAATKA